MLQVGLPVEEAITDLRRDGCVFPWCVRMVGSRSTLLIVTYRWIYYSCIQKLQTNTLHSPSVGRFLMLRLTFP